jgi:hypothetical protein
MSKEKTNLLFGAFTKMKLVGDLATNPTFDIRNTNEKLDAQLTNPRKIDEGDIDHYFDGEIDDDNDSLYDTAWLKMSNEDKRTVLDKEIKDYWDHKKTPPLKMNRTVVIYIFTMLSIMAFKYTVVFSHMIFGQKIY